MKHWLDTQTTLGAKVVPLLCLCRKMQAKTVCDKGAELDGVQSLVKETANLLIVIAV